MTLGAVTLLAAPAAAGPSTDDARALFDSSHRRGRARRDVAALGTFGCVMPTDPMETFAPAAVGDALAELAPRADATHDRLAADAAGASQDAIGLYVPAVPGT